MKRRSFLFCVVVVSSVCTFLMLGNRNHLDTESGSVIVSEDADRIDETPKEETGTILASKDISAVASREMDGETRDATLAVFSEIAPFDSTTDSQSSPNNVHSDDVFELNCLWQHLSDRDVFQLADSKESFVVPATLTGTLTGFASECDVLTLGEVHGTQEVPMVAIALLTPLTKLGYDVLALELPKDQQAPLIAWATGKTEAIPEFFSKPFGDGKGNAQLLSLIRVALSPSFRWKLICFDLSASNTLEDFEEWKRKSKEQPEKAIDSFVSPSDNNVALWQYRDAAMASNLASQLQELTPRPKVLAICGNIHNRIAITEKSWMKQLWPSFAAILQRDNADMKVGAINIRYHSGGYFNGGKVNEIQGRTLDQAEAHPALETGYHWELNLPHVTPATFLSPPVDPQ